MTYPQDLRAAWEAHLAPKALDAPTVISTFAGAGGSSLGYSMAGFRELLAVEIDKVPVATFRLNFPGVPVYHGDIADLSVEECMQLAGLNGPKELSVLDGSPPCQGFSPAGKRHLNDPRNKLAWEFIRLLRGLQPAAFVMENVPGLITGKMYLVFAEIMRELKSSGYRVSARLVNMAYFRVPQNRKRVIFIGVREDLGKDPTHPKPERVPYVLREVLDGDYRLKQAQAETPESAIKHWHQCRPGEYNKDRFSLNRGYWSGVPRTVMSEAGSSGHMHPDIPRMLTVGEVQRIQSFPDPFDFVGSWRQGIHCIGNSVPPMFMRAVAEHLRRQYLP